MQDALPDLWPSEVDQTAVLTPVAILRHQAALLSKRSHKVLEAEVVTESRPESPSEIRHGLELIVPALDYFRVRVLTIEHGSMQAYPVQLDLGSGIEYGSFKSANSQGEFIQALGALLGSDRVRATIHSLLAQANDGGASGAETAA